MNSHERKVYDQIFAHPIATNLQWRDFVHLFEVIGTDVEVESGDRVAVRMNGHREVFRREHNGRVGVEDIERARKLINATPADDPAQAELLVVALDTEHAKLLDLLGRKPAEVGAVTDRSPRARRLRTVQRRTGKDLDEELDHYFEQLREVLHAQPATLPIVVLGHGAGKADVAQRFVERIRQHDKPLAGRIVATGTIDLSAANDEDIAEAAVRLAEAG